MRHLTLIAILLVTLGSCTKDQMDANTEIDNAFLGLIRNVNSAGGDESFFILPSETDYANIPQDPKNPITAAKAELGKLLFFETGLALDSEHASGMGTYSCATCHIPSAGFRPGTKQGIADGGLGYGINGEDRVMNTEDYTPEELDVQGARPLSLINVAFVKNTSWNGQFGSTGRNIGTEDVWGVHRKDSELNFLGFEGIETQNFEGVHIHRFKVDKDIIDEYGYTDLFDQSFPELEDSLKYDLYGASLAISAYIRTILATEAPFQKYLKGNKNAMKFDEKEGGILFFGKANCAECHYNPNLGSAEFHALGVNDLDMIPSFNTGPDDFRNLGRGSFTNDPDDMFKYKVPGIYNMKDTPFYFHGSSETTIYDVVEYKSDRVAQNNRVPESQLSEKWLPLELTVVEKQKLTKFLEYSLRDPNLERYQPDEIGSGQCFPNADDDSIADLGCQ